MEETYCNKDLTKLAFIGGNRIYAKSRFSFNRNKGTIFIHSILNKSILCHIHYSKDRFKVVNNSANMPSQTMTIQNDVFKYGKLISAHTTIEQIR